MSRSKSSETTNPAPSARKQRVLSGIQPTADFYYLGNYLGVLKNQINLQDDFDAYYFIPDPYAIVAEQNPKGLRQRTIAGTAQLVALGIDPEKSVLFVQSYVPEYAEPGWVLTRLTGFGEASRMAQFKDKSSRQGAEHTPAGLFVYPMLMAADILLYRPQLVPAEEDQRQYLGLTRDLAQRFNSRYKKTFVMLGPHIMEGSAKIYDLQDSISKTSKSGANPKGIINLLDDPKVSAKRIRPAVTDNDGEICFDRENKPRASNLLVTQSALTDKPVDELAAGYEGVGYGQLKADTADALEAFTTPLCARYEELMADRGELERILVEGADHACEAAARTLADMYERVGFLKATNC